MENMEERQVDEMIWKIWKKAKLNSEKIWKIWKKSKLNSEMENMEEKKKIWKIWKKNSEYGKYGRK